MTTAEHKRILEDAKKERIVILEIEHPIGALGGTLSDERRNRAMKMSLAQLQQLATSIKGAQTYREMIELTVGAICDSEQAVRTAKQKKWRSLCPPARMEMFM